MPVGSGEDIASTLVRAVSELQEVLRAVEEGAARGERMALATIVGVSGSTYRREGARLLVPEHGRPVGTISGGCLEGDVRAAAAEVMAEGRARLIHFDLTADDEVVWGWGLGCNGVIDVFVEPADGAVHAAGTIRRAVDQQQALVAVTVVQLSEDGGVRLGARLIVHADGTVDGSLGDPSIDRQARSEGLRALEDGRSGTLPLGEEIRAFFEVLVPPLRLIVCGAGHDAVPLVRFASGLGWKVEVVDDREQFLKPRRFPDADRFVKAEPGDAARRAGVDERTYVVVMSHNFLRDKDYLRSFLGSPAPYIGMLGPAARLERLLAELRREGYDPDPRDLEVVHGPAGLDLGGDGPEEVAWAIVGEVLAVAKGRRGGFLRDRGGPIHDRAGPAHDPVAAKRG
ncbi:MAG: XdhC family protein [Actinobacteria bacterium]|nr:MAG: XdhC family protein [Actinomycetota bacterium]